ncbi:hypothetical protein [Paenibacillus campi]|uniref:hypothetical protein n=1 Tax=Paenibacillus campi TaxID=3106031 RepID=UPI002AFEDB96|nr:hypothetical protein [Paenibacillus sp. SGZ-1009]
MKKRSTWILAIATIGIGVWVGSAFTTVSNASSQLGSADDPVVTKSYVDQQIQKALGGNLNSSSSTSASNNSSNTSSGSKNNSTAPSGSSSTSSSTSTTSPSTSTTTGNSTTNSSVTAASNINIVELAPGKTLLAKAGTEVIVRHGNAVVFSPGANGIVDVTAGTDLGGGQMIANNHMLLFPRDGRGVMVVSSQSSNATLMVIGSYVVQ